MESLPFELNLVACTTRLKLGGCSKLVLATHEYKTDCSLSVMTLRRIFTLLFWNGIGGGLEEQIGNFLLVHPDTALIVIDSLQKVCSLTNNNTYVADYHDIGLIKGVGAQRLRLKSFPSVVSSERPLTTVR